jgi:hypothetical protein
MQKKNLKQVCADFLRKCAFLGKRQNFQARCGRFSHDPIFFLCLKVLEGFKYDKKGATKRISKKVLFQATLLQIEYKKSMETTIGFKASSLSAH